MKKKALKAMEFTHLYDALMTLELCEISARLDKRDVPHALYFCCQRLRRKYDGKRAKAMINAVMESQMPVMCLRTYRQVFDNAVEKSVDVN